MLKSYFKLAVRNLLKRKDYSILNILGLSIGITCCLLIFQYVSYERSYDTFLPNADRVFRLRLDSYQQGRLNWQSAAVYPAFGPAMKPMVDQLSKLGDALLNGVDANNNGQIEPIKGECGAAKAYELGWFMSDFYIFAGPNRVPPSGK